MGGDPRHCIVYSVYVRSAETFRFNGLEDRREVGLPVGPEIDESQIKTDEGPQFWIRSL